MVIMLILAPTFSFMKFWIHYKFTPCANFLSVPWLSPFFGIFEDRLVHTFVCDLLVIPFAGLLAWHYTDQIK